MGSPLLSTPIALFLLGIAILMVFIGLPMAMGKIKQNGWYGVRLPITMRSMAAWDAANKQYGWWMILGGVACALVVPCAWLTSASHSSIAVLFCLAIFVPLIGGLVPSVIGAYRAAAVESGEPEETPAEDTRDDLPSQFG